MVVAGNGARAVELALGESFDAVLMDVQMPELDGLEATAAIRQAEGAGGPGTGTPDTGTPDTGARLPIIAMTAHAREEDRQRCLAAGMDDFLTKPLSQETLFECLERWTRDRGRAGAGLDGSRGPGGADDGAPAQPGPAEQPPAPEEEPPVDGSARAVWDREASLERTGGDAALLGELAQVFLGDLPAKLEAIEAAVAGKDAEALRGAAHSLKGAVSTFGAEPARLAALALEELGKSGRLDGAEAAAARLRVEVERLVEVLEELQAGELRQTSRRSQ